MTAAAERLEVAKTYKLYVNGAFPRSESGRSLAIHDRKGNVLAHVSHGSRKDLRDAVEAAASAQPKWAAASAYNRGQVLYRMAEMMQGKRNEFAEAIRETSESRETPKHRNVETPKDDAAKRKAGKSGKGRRAATVRERKTAAISAGAKPVSMSAALREVDAAIDRLVAFGGWADKYAQVLGCNNPVAGPYYNFTVPEPTGVVGVVAPSRNAPALLGMISLLAPVICPGNAAVLVASGGAMLPAAILGEVCATSDVPAGVVNVLTSDAAELLPHLAQHRAINAVAAANLSKADAATLRLGVAENLKRVSIAAIGSDGWFDAATCENPWTIEPFVEMKTIWHPAGA